MDWVAENLHSLLAPKVRPEANALTSAPTHPDLFTTLLTTFTLSPPSSSSPVGSFFVLGLTLCVIGAHHSYDGALLLHWDCPSQHFLPPSPPLPIDDWDLFRWARAYISSPPSLRLGGLADDYLEPVIGLGHMPSLWLLLRFFFQYS